MPYEKIVALRERFYGNAEGLDELERFTTARVEELTQTVAELKQQIEEQQNANGHQ